MQPSPVDPSSYVRSGPRKTLLMLQMVTSAARLMAMIADMVSRPTIVQVTPRKLRKTRQLRVRLETSALVTTRTGTKKDQGKKVHF